MSTFSNSRCENAHAQAFIVERARREADDIRIVAGGRQKAEAEELFVPVRIILVIHLGHHGGIAGIDAADNVLLADQFHVELPLRLTPQDFNRACENDDEAVARVDRLRDHTSEICSLSALHVADNESFGLPYLFLERIGEALHDPRRSLVEAREGVCSPSFSAEQIGIGTPVKVLLGAALRRVPRLKLVGDDNGDLALMGKEVIEGADYGSISRDPEAAIHERAPLGRARGGVFCPYGLGISNVPSADGNVQLLAERVVEVRSR